MIIPAKGLCFGVSRSLSAILGAYSNEKYGLGKKWLDCGDDPEYFVDTESLFGILYN